MIESDEFDKYKSGIHRFLNCFRIALFVYKNLKNGCFVSTIVLK